jgi:hypothetical protein
MSSWGRILVNVELVEMRIEISGPIHRWDCNYFGGALLPSNRSKDSEDGRSPGAKYAEYT